MSEVVVRRGAELEEFLSGSRRKVIGAARRDVTQIAVRKLSMSAAQVARRLGASKHCLQEPDSIERDN